MGAARMWRSCGGFPAPLPVPSWSVVLAGSSGHFALLEVAGCVTAGWEFGAPCPAGAGRLRQLPLYAPTLPPSNPPTHPPACHASPVLCCVVPAEPLLLPVARLVQDCMEGVAGALVLRVPLRVRLASGPSWGELQEVRLSRA